VRADSNRRVNLIKLLGDHKYDSALITTFGFDADFFESYCLDDLRAFAGNGNITILLDERTYDELLARPPQDRPEKANLRYLLHPIQVPGAFHPKVILCTSARRGLLLVGSANFTRQGLTSNAELVGAFEFELEKNEIFRPLFGRALAFFMSLAERFPSESLQSNLDATMKGSIWLRDDERGDLDSLGMDFLDNLEDSLWDQVVLRLDGAVERVHVVSRFFDYEPHLLDRVARDLKPREIVIYTQNQVTTLSERWLDHPSVRSGRTVIRLCSYRDEDYQQPLHAKALAFEQAKGTVLAYGSANFTSAALLSRGSERNVEVLLVTKQLPTNKVKPDALFDPEGSGVVLGAKSELLTAPRSVDDSSDREGRAVRLLHAEVVETSLECRISTAVDVAVATLKAVLVTGDGGRAELRLGRTDGDGWSAGMTPELVSRVNRQATSAYVLAATSGGQEVRSNEVFLINLQDPVSGIGIRRDRRLREAENSAAQFAGVLGELLRSGDERALLFFLNYCDIPISQGPRPPAGRAARDPAPDPTALRRLAEENRRFLEVIHEAALAFIDRHLGKLEKNAGSPSLRGVSSFMHVARAVGDVIQSQLVSVAAGLAPGQRPLQPGEWSSLRLKVDQYLQRSRTLADIVGQEFIPALRGYYEESEVAEEMQPDLDPFMAFFQKLMDLSSEIQTAPERGIRVRTVQGKLVEPMFSVSNVLSVKQWPRLHGELVLAMQPLSNLANLSRGA
jgi:hypothetical protein